MDNSTTTHNDALTAFEAVSCQNGQINDNSQLCVDSFCEAVSCQNEQNNDNSHVCKQLA